MIRQRQGIAWTKEEPKGIQANLEHLVSVQVKPNVQPVAEDALQLAYGAAKAPKLVSEICSPLLKLRQKALIQVIKTMATPKELEMLLAAGLVHALNTAAKDDDDIVRTSANLALAQAARYPGGQKAMLANGSIEVLIESDGAGIYSENEGVRAHALRAVLELAKNPDGCRALIQAYAVKVLIARISNEVPPLQGLALMALQQLMVQRDGVAHAISEGAMAVIIPILSSQEQLAREKAALALGALTTEFPEKREAGPSALQPLVTMLADEALSARHAASSALMSLTVENSVKELAIGAQVPEALDVALDECVRNETLPEGDRDKLISALTVNLVQTIDQVAEHPKARRYFKSKGTLRKLQQFETSSNIHVRKHTSKAIAQITWMP